MVTVIFYNYLIENHPEENFFMIFIVKTIQISLNLFVSFMISLRAIKLANKILAVIVFNV